MNANNQEKVERTEEEPASYGGYSVRQSYEKRLRRPWHTPALVALYLLLFLLSMVGLVALFRGNVFSDAEITNKGASEKVTIPVINTKDLDPESAVAEVEDTLITVELEQESGAPLRGTGFIVSEEGIAVCHSSLFAAAPRSITVYTGDGVVTAAEKAGEIPSLGVVVLRLDRRHTYQAVALTNNNIQRGQYLYGVAAVSRGSFYGLTLEGIATSTAENVTVTVGEEERSIPILYTSIPHESTMKGALAITVAGGSAGFLTDTLPGRGGMAAVPIITLVGLVNEITHAS